MSETNPNGMKLQLGETGNEEHLSSESPILFFCPFYIFVSCEYNDRFGGKHIVDS